MRHPWKLPGRLPRSIRPGMVGLFALLAFLPIPARAGQLAWLDEVYATVES